MGCVIVSALQCETMNSSTFPPVHCEIAAAVRMCEPTVSWVDTADGARLRVMSFGPDDAPTIVLAHGWACRAEYWLPQIQGLAGEFRVVCYDQRGHGFSTTGDRDIDGDVVGDDLAAVMDAAVASPAIVIGHSMGGISILSWWKRHPEQAKQKSVGAVLANTTLGSIATETKIMPFNNGSELAIRIGRILLGATLPMPRGRLTRDAVRKLVMNPRRTTDEQANFVCEIARTCNAGVRARTALALADLDLGDEAAEAVGVPAVVTTGTFDQVLPDSMGKRIAEIIDRTGHLEALVELETGHTGNIEAPEKFNDIARKLAERYLLAPPEAGAEPAAKAG